MEKEVTMTEVLAISALKLARMGGGKFHNVLDTALKHNSCPTESDGGFSYKALRTDCGVGTQQQNHNNRYMRRVAYLLVIEQGNRRGKGSVYVLHVCMAYLWDVVLLARKAIRLTQRTTFTRVCTKHTQ